MTGQELLNALREATPEQLAMEMVDDFGYPLNELNLTGEALVLEFAETCH